MNPQAKSISPRNPSKTSFLTFDMVGSSKTQTPFSPTSARIISMQLARKQHTSHSSGAEMYSKISLMKFIIMQHCFHVSKRSNSIRITSHESFNQSARLRRLFLAFRAAKRPLSGRPQVPPWIAQGLFVKGCRGAKLNIQNFSITLHKTTYPFCSNSNSYKTETKHQSSAVTSANPRLNVRSETAEGACPSCSTHGC